MGKWNYQKRCAKKLQQYKNSLEYKKLKMRFYQDKMFEQQIQTWRYSVNGLEEIESKPKLLMTEKELKNLNKLE